MPDLDPVHRLVYLDNAAGNGVMLLSHSPSCARLQNRSLALDLFADRVGMLVGLHKYPSSIAIVHRYPLNAKSADRQMGGSGGHNGAGCSAAHPRPSG
jgi:hypothetical protein